VSLESSPLQVQPMSMASPDDGSEDVSRPRRFSAARTSLIQSRAKPISHECLREHAFFKDRDSKLLDLLLESISVEVFLPGSDIITEGDDGECMYFMYRGEVDILVGPDQKKVATLRDGSLFGEMALLGNGKRAATIRAAGVCDCRVISAVAFHTCLKRFPAEKIFFHQLARERLAELNKTRGGKTSTTFSLRPPPGKATEKFKRASHAMMAMNKLKKPKASSAPTSRVTTAIDDLVVPKGALTATCSRVSTVEDNLVIPKEALASSRVSTSEDMPLDYQKALGQGIVGAVPSLCGVEDLDSDAETTLTPVSARSPASPPPLPSGACRRRSSNFSAVSPLSPVSTCSSRSPPLSAPGVSRRRTTTLSPVSPRSPTSLTSTASAVTRRRSQPQPLTLDRALDNFTRPEPFACARLRPADIKNEAAYPIGDRRLRPWVECCLSGDAKQAGKMRREPDACDYRATGAQRRPSDSPYAQGINWLSKTRGVEANAPGMLPLSARMVSIALADN